MKREKLYHVEFKEKDILKQELSPGWYRIPVHATSMYDAARKAVRPLIRVDLFEEFPSANNYQVWHARILDTTSPKKPYTIIRNGGWVIDVTTGRRNEDLEERLGGIDYPQGQPLN